MKKTIKDEVKVLPVNNFDNISENICKIVKWILKKIRNYLIKYFNIITKWKIPPSQQGFEHKPSWRESNK